MNVIDMTDVQIYELGIIVDSLIPYTSSELRNPYGTGDQQPMLHV